MATKSINDTGTIVNGFKAATDVLSPRFHFTT
jgi:hypothetical protein